MRKEEEEEKGCAASIGVANNPCFQHVRSMHVTRQSQIMSVLGINSITESNDGSTQNSLSWENNWNSRHTDFSATSTASSAK